MTPGYSGTPLPKKLGLKDGQRALFVNLPADLEHLVRAADYSHVARADWDDWTGEGWDVVQVFTASRAQLDDNALRLKSAISRDGMVWVCWPKKASKVPTDITEDVIRDLLLPTGLVDIKVAAVSEIWSGLKLMIRKELR